jgi:hypothetical protein
MMDLSLCVYCNAGLASLALSLVTVFSDFSEGYSIAKTSMNIAGSDKRVLCYILTIMYGMINIWKEPIQAILPQLKDVYNMSLKYGLIDNALASGMLHAYRAFFTGSLLKPFSKEVALFMRNNSERHKRKLMHLSVLPVSNGISFLCGRSGPQIAEEFITEENLAEALQNKESTVCEAMLAIKMMCSFIFRRLDEVKATADSISSCLSVKAELLHNSSIFIVFSTVVCFRCSTIEKVENNFGWIEQNMPSKRWKSGRQKVFGTLRINCSCCKQKDTMLLMNLTMQQKSICWPKSRLRSIASFTRRPWLASLRLPFMRKQVMCSL